MLQVKPARKDYISPFCSEPPFLMALIYMQRAVVSLASRFSEHWRLCVCVGEVWVSQNERNISRYNKKRHSLLWGVQKWELVWAGPPPPCVLISIAHIHRDPLKLGFSSVSQFRSLSFLHLRSNLYLCFCCNIISGPWPPCILLSKHPHSWKMVFSHPHSRTLWGKKAYFSQHSSSLTPPASISQIIMSLTLIFTLNQNALMRIRAFLAKNDTFSQEKKCHIHTGNNLHSQKSPFGSKITLEEKLRI